MSTITIETLQPFCSTDDSGPVLHAPFYRDGRTWATNGRIMVWVEGKLDGVPERDNAPNCMAIIPAAVPVGWLPVPDVEEREPAECEHCAGCGACEALARSGATGETEPTGMTVECPWCEGSGKIDPYTDEHYHMLAGSKLADRYLVAIRKYLPNPKLAPSKDPHGKCWIRFDGGEGLVMPMRSDA